MRNIQAADLSGITNLIHEYAIQIQVLGGAFLVIAIILVGIKLGAKSVGSGQNGIRETFGSVLTIVVAAVLIGGALIFAPLLIGVGGG